MGASQHAESVSVVNPERRGTINNDNVGGQDQMRASDRSIGNQAPGLRGGDVHHRLWVAQHRRGNIDGRRLIYLYPKPTKEKISTIVENYNAGMEARD